MALEHLTSKNFDEKINGQSGVVLVDFYSDTCGPCKMLAPVLEEFAASRNDITVYKVDVAEENQLAVKFGVMHIPTLIVFNNGEKVKTSVGLISKSEIEELVKC